MARARYLVTEPPGAYVPAIGFIKAGDSFDAPDDPKFVPSYTFRALNQEASEELKKLAETLRVLQAKKLDEMKRREELELERLNPLNRLKTDVYVPPKTEAPVQREVVKPAELAEITRITEPDAAPASSKQQTQQTPSKQRTADK